VITKNLHVYPSNFKNETRILKETKSLVESGIADKIFIAAIWEDGVEEYEQLDRKREVWRVPLKISFFRNSQFGKVLRFGEWYLKIFFRYKKEHIAFFNSHCLSALPIGLIFKLFTKSKLVYDAHELETEVIGAVGFKKKIAKVIEKLLVHFVDIVIVVSDSIAKWYKDHYNLKEVYVIKNFPASPEKENENSNILRDKFNIQQDEILFIYQGLLSEGRGVKILLNVFSKTNKKKHIVFMGYGILESLIKEFEKNSSNIHFHPAVIPEDVIPYTQSADVGISLIENICLSYFYSLPNKVFEYLMSGLPLIVSDFPDMGKIVEENKCGWKVSVNEKSPLELIEKLSKEDIQEKRKNVLTCRNNYSWENEEKKLVSIYHKLSIAK